MKSDVQLSMPRNAPLNMRPNGSAVCMRERRFGRIIHMGSGNGQSGQAGRCSYAATKAGLVGLSRSLALEGVSHSITVNVVAPDHTDTAMVAAVPPM